MVSGRARRLVRGIASWLPAIVLVPAAVVAGVVVAEPHDEYDAMRAFSPLDLGTTWVYEVFDHEKSSGTRTSQVLGRSLLVGFEENFSDAVRVSRNYTEYPGVGPRSNVSYLGVNGQTMVQYALVENSSFAAIDPPAPAYKLPVEVGQKFSYEGTVAGTPIAFDTELVEIGPVEVGGRTFEGCSHFTNVIAPQDEKDPDSAELQEEWTCPGYGPVRSVTRVESTDVEITEELVEFHGDAGNWYAQGREPTVDLGDGTLPGSTVGFDAARTFAVPDGELGRRLAWTDMKGERGLMPPVSDGEVMVLAERDGQVSLRTTGTGAVRWRVGLAGPLIAPPVLAGDVVLVPDSTKRLWALSVEDGRALWTHEFGDVVSASPVAAGDGVAVPTDDGQLTMLRSADGDVSWEVTLGGAARTSPAFDGERLVVGDQSGTVSAFDPDDGDLQWSHSLDQGLAQGPAIAGDRVLVQDQDGIVHAYTPDGDQDWQSQGRGAPSAPMSVGNGAVVTMSSLRDVAALDADTGTRLWSRSVATTYATPVVVGNEVVLGTREGEMLVLSLDDGRVVDRWGLPAPYQGTEFFNDVAPALVGGTLVVTAFVGSGPTHTVLYAYPVDKTAPASGVMLRLRSRTVPGVPNEPPTLVGDRLVMAAGQELLVVSPDGKARTLLKSKGIQTGAAVEGGVVVARRNEEMQARRLEDGEELWSAAGGPSDYAALASTSPDMAFYGIAGLGLTGVDLQTGLPRWASPIPEMRLVVTPVTLPGGDVIFGGGGLARYDGASGEREWWSPDAHSINTPIHADGVVYADGVGLESGNSGIGAYDAKTGERLWWHPKGSVQRHVGPATGSGVVVSGDGTGLVSGLAAADGEVLWEIRLRHALAGAPVVQDDFVYLSEGGTGQDARDVDYRISVHELETGQFVGSWEPAAMPLTASPNVGGSPGGPLLVPTNADVTEVEATR